MKVGVIDCGVGNIGSITNIIRSLKLNDVVIEIISDNSSLLKYNLIILPGVGSFNGYMDRLKCLGMDKTIINFANNKSGVLLGICVGMQVLFDFGYENKKSCGLGVIPGEVAKINGKNDSIRIPHVGWNNVSFLDKELFDFNGDYYFTHSFTAYTEGLFVSGVCEYGDVLTASVSNCLIHVLQFHPEKSVNLGKKMLNHYCTKAAFSG